MPLPQSPDHQPYILLDAPAMTEAELRRRSEESIRTEDCEGPVPDEPMESLSPPEGNAEASSSNGEAVCSNRAELIERLKRGESPQWIPNRSVSAKMGNLAMLCGVPLYFLYRCPREEAAIPAK